MNKYANTTVRNLYIYDRCRLVKPATSVVDKAVVTNPAGTFEVQIVAAWCSNHLLHFRCMIHQKDVTPLTDLHEVLHKVPGERINFSGYDVPVIAAAFVCDRLPAELEEFFDPLLSEEEARNLRNKYNALQQVRIAGMPLGALKTKV